MNEDTVNIRLMKADDYYAVIAIDKKVIGIPRTEYYTMKFERLFKSREYLPTSLVAEAKDGAVIGFIMGELYMGEFGIFQEQATLDTIGVDPSWRKKGVGAQLIHEYMVHLKSLGVQKVNTLVDPKDTQMTHFFRANQFITSPTINLERCL